MNKNNVRKCTETLYERSATCSHYCELFQAYQGRSIVLKTRERIYSLPLAGSLKNMILRINEQPIY